MKTATACGLSILLWSALANAQVPPASGGARSLAEQVDILRVVVTRELNKAIPAKYAAATFPYVNVMPRHVKASKSHDPSGSDPDATDEKRDKDAKGASEADEPSDETKALTYYDGRDPAGEAAWNMLRMYRGANQALLGASSQFTSHTRSFYVPSVGAFIDTTIELPLVAETVRSSERGEVDAWEAAKRDLRGGLTEAGAAYESWRSAVQSAPTTAHFVMPEEAIQAAIEAAVETLRKYADHIDGLPSREDVVVAIEFEPSQSILHTSDGALNGFVRYSTEADPSGLQRFGAGGTPARQRAVIHVPAELLARQRDGQCDERQFRQAVKVTRY